VTVAEAASGGFDLAAHLAALVIHALDDPQQAPAAGWLAAFAGDGREAVPLADLAAARDALPPGPWREGDDPRPLLALRPVFGVGPAGGPLRTEAAELMGQDWRAADQRLTLFAPLAPRLPEIRARAAAYLEVLSEWYRGGAPAVGGRERVCHLYAALFNERLYFEAFKLMEMRWMVEADPAGKSLLRGLMQLAVGLHQIESGRYAVPQLEEGYARIREGASAFPSPTLGRFLKRLEKAIRLLKAYGPEKYRSFDLELFPRLWMVSPWRLLLGLGRRR
jgi:hypothetical protein